MPSFACFRRLFWRTPSTLKFLNQVRPKLSLFYYWYFCAVLSVVFFFNYPAGTRREREREREEREREIVTLYSICFLGVMCLFGFCVSPSLHKGDVSWSTL